MIKVSKISDSSILIGRFPIENSPKIRIKGLTHILVLVKNIKLFGAILWCGRPIFWDLIFKRSGQMKLLRNQIWSK